VSEDAGVAAAPRPPGKKRPWWRKPLLRLATVAAPALLSAVLRLLSWTLRVSFLNGTTLFGRWDAGERVIIAFWHNRLLMMPIAAAGRPICILNSQHRDGEIATRVASRWNVRSVRGSATRGAVAGFLSLVRAYREGFSLAVVPDGPRGPRYQAKVGVVQLARVTGAAIIPVSYATDRHKRLRSWDRLIIPLPFARVVFAVGEPLRVARDADDALIESQRQMLEERLNELGRSAEGHLAV
jgi:lysophospholipid acyltransferase (LPLAT)-like uncharacterized protein